jgi:hypothetical protein
MIEGRGPTVYNIFYFDQVARVAASQSLDRKQAVTSLGCYRLIGSGEPRKSGSHRGRPTHRNSTTGPSRHEDLLPHNPLQISCLQASPLSLRGLTGGVDLAGLVRNPHRHYYA